MLCIKSTAKQTVTGIVSGCSTRCWKEQQLDTFGNMVWDHYRHQHLLGKGQRKLSRIKQNNKYSYRNASVAYLVMTAHTCPGLHIIHSRLRTAPLRSEEGRHSIKTLRHSRSFFMYVTVRLYR